MCWNRADTETFAKLVGGMELSAVRGSNPLLLFVTIVALARAFHRARCEHDYTAMAGGVLKGALGTGSANFRSPECPVGVMSRERFDPAGMAAAT